MMEIYYFLPVLFIAGVVGYSFWARKKAANMSPEEIEENFHNIYAPYFRLRENEKIVGTWAGVAFQGPKSQAGHLASDAINGVAAAAIGVSTYVPHVQVALTSNERLLVSREHSELGKRGNFKQHIAFEEGVDALDSKASYPNTDIGSPPKNPFNPKISLEFVQPRARDNGEIYDARMSPQGTRIGQTGFCSILSNLAS